jgi:hypothetical protein
MTGTQTYSFLAAALRSLLLIFSSLARFLFQPTPFPLRLVANADEVIGKLLDGVGGCARLDALGVVGDENSHVGLDDHNTFSALRKGKHIRQCPNPITSQPISQTSHPSSSASHRPHLFPLLLAVRQLTFFP